MRVLVATLSCAALLALGVTSASAATKGEAKALTERGVAHCQKVGRDQCVNDFTENTGGEWVEGELYVFALDMEGLMLGHGANKGLVGKRLFKLKDKMGKLFVQDFIEVAQGTGEGWVLYHWPDPITKKLRPKASFIKKVDDGYFLGVGIYR